jgi:hypothetical protein
MKICSKCGIEKDESEYGKHSGVKCGLQPSCRACIAIVKKIYRDNHKEEAKEYIKIWEQKNPDKVNEKIKRANAKKKESGYQENRYKNNIEKIKIANALRYKDKKEEIDKKNREYAAQHKEKGLARSREWRSRNPEKVANQNLKRREARASIRILAKSEELTRLLEMQNYKCANKSCRCDLRTNKRHIDHKNPIHLGGSGEIENLQWLCAPCNLRKAHMPFDEWEKRNGNG